MTSLEFLQKNYQELVGKTWTKLPIISDEWIAQQMDDYAALKMKESDKKPIKNMLGENGDMDKFLYVFGKMLISQFKEHGLKNHINTTFGNGNEIFELTFTKKHSKNNN